MSTPEINARIESLLAQMTLTEKIGQLYQISDDDESIEGGLHQAIRDGRIGSIINAKRREPIYELQRLAVEESRLGIPILFGRDVIHGFRTIAPIPLGQAATWNAALVERCAEVAAKEAASVGIHWTFAPSLDIARDARWGRIAETCGEDPYLTSVLGAATIRGFQGQDPAQAGRILACAKHFAGYGAAEGGRDYNTTNIPEVLLRNVYLPPFQAAVQAGVATFMSGFNDLNGVPASGNELLFRQVLRKEWGFEGFVVSDWESITEMIEHGFCADQKSAAWAAARAGIDMEMVSRTFLNHLPGLLEEGLISMEIVDQAVARVLRWKLMIGLFERPYPDMEAPLPLKAPSHLEAAYEAAVESLVLLKNENQALPLNPGTGKVAIIGPLADAPREQMGTWIFDGQPEDSVTPVTALREWLGEERCLYAPGLTYSRDESTDWFGAALSAAQAADTVLFFAGEESILSGEAHSRALLHLPGAQMELLRQLASTGKPVVLVVLAGRPLAIGEAADLCVAVVYAWHPGTMGGPAIIDLLFGKCEPSGRLPVSFPKDAGQIPIYYNHHNTGRPASKGGFARMAEIKVGTKQVGLPNTSYYLDLGVDPLYPFGYGLSYSNIAYEVPTVSSTEFTEAEPLTISVQIRNTGLRPCKETVQLYIRDLFASMTRPVKELKQFQQVILQAGATQEVHFRLKAADLSFYGPDGDLRLEPGAFELMVGPNSRDVQGVRVTLLEKK